MRAAQIKDYGGPDVMQTVDDVPKPEPDADQLLVEVHAAAVNPFDWKVRQGYMKDSVPLQLPATLGGDFAGIVAQVGANASGFEVGQEVYGQANALSGHGSYAEFTPVKAESLTEKPSNTDFVAAAALPLAGVSAYQALVEHINLQTGQKILIHGGAGGIGSLAIQLAKYIGAYVASTAATDDIEFVKGLGADEVIDYQNQAFETILKDYDAVFDTVGGETYDKSYQVLKPGGIIVSMIASPNQDAAGAKNIQAIAQQTRLNPERLSKLTELVEAGAIKVEIDKVFPLDGAAEALEYIKQGHHRGKVVIKVKD
jgi:NADPH:quinone reductase-like Zn-dependent oxidoreductase